MRFKLRYKKSIILSQKTDILNIKQRDMPHSKLTLVLLFSLGPGGTGPGVGLSVSFTAATAAKDGQPRGGESSCAALPVIVGTAGCAPQRERRPGARLLQCPA